MTGHWGLSDNDLDELEQIAKIRGVAYMLDDLGLTGAANRHVEAVGIVRRFHEAWWNWEPGDDTQQLDAAASEAMAYLGDVIRLREEPT